MLSTTASEKTSLGLESYAYGAFLCMFSIWQLGSLQVSSFFKQCKDMRVGVIDDSILAVGVNVSGVNVSLSLCAGSLTHRWPIYIMTHVLYMLWFFTVTRQQLSRTGGLWACLACAPVHSINSHRETWCYNIWKAEVKWVLKTMKSIHRCHNIVCKKLIYNLWANWTIIIIIMIPPGFTK